MVRVRSGEAVINIGADVLPLGICPNHVPVVVLLKLNALLAVLCAIDYFVPKMHWGDRWIKKFANWCGDCIYKREINKGKKYLEMK